jgi:ABC-2 type transport system permease protein
MSPPLVLLVYSLKRVRTMVAVMGVLLGIFQVFLILVAGSIHRSQAFEQMGALMPPFVRELVGPAFTSLLSFQGIVCVGYFHVAVMGALIALSIVQGTTVSGEVESGFVDLILARPVSRHWMITRSIVVMMLSTLALLLMMMLGTWAGLKALAPVTAASPRPGLILSLAANLAVLMCCWHSIALAVASASRRRSVAGLLAGFLALAAFLLDYVARAWTPAASAGWLSPFRYYSPFELLMGKALPLGNILVLVGISLAGFGTAYVLFSRRDLMH